MPYRRAAAAAVAFGACLTAMACGAEDNQQDVDPAAISSAGPSFVGCVAQTGQPDVFLLTVARGRNEQADGAPGSVVPRASGEPTGAQPTNASPVGTGGNPPSAPGDRAAQPTTAPGAGPMAGLQLETYRLAGSGGVDFAAHVGHTVEVNGTIRQLPGDQQSDGTRPLMGELQVATARVIAQDCAR